MEKPEKLILLGGLLVVRGCNPDSQALDSSANLLLAPPNVVQAFTLDVPWPCELATRKQDDKAFRITNDQALWLMKAAECRNRELNQQYPQQTRITVVVHLASPTNDTTMYLRYIPLYFSDSTMGVAARKMLQLAGFPDSLDPATAVVASAAGRYSASNYLRAIRTTTPLVVFLPMNIQGNKLTPAIYQATCARVKAHTQFP